jgi:hypothetical protein
MIRRLIVPAFVALGLAGPALVAQDAPAAKPKKPAISTVAWPDEDELALRSDEALRRTLFQDGPAVEFALSSDFGSINKERTPNNAKQFDAVLTANGTDLPVKLGSRGHLRLKSQTCDFVPIKVTFARDRVGGTLFDGQTSLKLGTHCRDSRDFDQYVVREYLSYKFANLATPLSFRARLAHATYVDAKSKKKISTHNALFLENENDVARRLRGRETRVPHMVFDDFDRQALTTMMLVEYMLGNTDYSIWAQHNVVVVQDRARKFYPVPYDFDSSGMVNPPYAAPDPRLHIKALTDRLYRGPCRSVDEFDAAAEPFRAHQADMFRLIEQTPELDAFHKRDMRSFLDSFFRRIATRDAIKSFLVDGCPASRSRV